jgi:hypothetical protein
MMPVYKGDRIPEQLIQAYEQLKAEREKTKAAKAEAAKLESELTRKLQEDDWDGTMWHP